MNVLVTGAGGFVGRYAVRDLCAHGHRVVAADLEAPREIPEGARPALLDVRDAAAAASLVRDTVPDACLHLAGLSFVPEAASNPDLVLSVNVRGTLNLLEAFRRHAPSARFLFVSTAQVYGMREEPAALDEEAPLAPLSMYAVSKAAADLAALAHAVHYGMPVMTARPSNHTGPGQAPRFAVAAFARQVREIAAGLRPAVIRTGNRESLRDFSDVRDVVRAYRLLLERGTPGRAYNIAGRTQVRIGDVLDRLCHLAGITPRIEDDPALMRPTDRAPVLDTARLRAETGWAPVYELDQTLRDMLDQDMP